MTATETLLGENQELYQKSINHPLTNELCDGTLSNSKLYTYLVQDSKFFAIGLQFFAKTLSLCVNNKSAITLGRQIGFITNDENDYFEKCLDLLVEMPEVKQNTVMVNDKPSLPKVEEYLKFIEYLVYESKSYAECVTALYVMEKVYLGWADLNLQQGRVPQDLHYRYKEWINLHSGENFTKWVKFLEDEVNTVADETNWDLCQKAFYDSIRFEVDFFDECYNYSE